MPRCYTSLMSDVNDVIIEKRAAPRQRVLKRGMIVYGGGSADCTVRNLSATGARVDIESLTGLPNSFMLVIESDQFMRRGRPVWYTDKKLGIAFE